MKDKIKIYTKQANVKKPSGLILIKNKMNLVEHKTYNYLIKIANKDLLVLNDDEKQTHKGIFTTNFNDLMKLMNVTNKSDVINGLNGLLDNRLNGDNVILKKGQENWNIRTNFLSEWKYKNGKEEIIFQLPNSIIELILDKNSIFSDLNLVELSKLQKKHSIWLYEVINDYKNIKEKTYSVEDIRFLGGLDEEKYPRVTDLKKYVIDVACDEINSKTSFKIDYIVNKKGRNIISFTFLFRDESKDKLNEQDIFKKWIKYEFLNKKLTSRFHGDLTFKIHKGTTYLYYNESNKIIEKSLSFEIYDYLYLKKNDVFKSYQNMRKKEGRQKSKFKNIKDLLIAFESRLKGDNLDDRK